ncbi:hypothetical protein RRG08_021872 [Elysia crispata]|uniref:Uncharacterized protein n=1 Tax=Elysia crispata TaxID=231223 RepID=A0AAE0YFV6_9GAST|nr:hypothetical protein RRG08_021872 [Elysia crispata]
MYQEEMVNAKNSGYRSQKANM